ncbi:hypothetical protein HDU97_010400 [Phlyctochytrium planicorne]|nr:hypothetical protein HDU97_010400 [Phlyctochytrium planicorne]
MISSLGGLSILPIEILTEILKNLDASDWKLCLKLEAIVQNLHHIYNDQEAFVNDYKTEGILGFFPATAFWIQRLKIDDVVPQLKTVLQVALLDQLMPNIWTPARLSITLISIPIVRYLRTRIPTYSFYQRTGDSKETVVDRCVTLGNIELVKCIRETFPGAFSKLNLVLAAREGALEMVRFLVEVFERNGYRGRALAVAARRGDMEMVKMLCDGRPDVFSEKALAAASRNGNLDMARFLVESTGFRGFSEKALLAAVEIGRLDIARLLVESTGFRGVSEKILWGATMRMELPMLEFLVGLVRKVGNWAELKKRAGDVVHHAVSGGRLDVVELFHESFGGLMKLSTDTMDEAAKGGHLEVVEFLHRHRDEGCTERAMDGAAIGGHFEIVKFLHFNRTEGCTTMAMDRAANCGHLEIVEFLHFNRSEGCTLDAARSVRTVEILKFLHMNRPKIDFSWMAEEAAKRRWFVNVERYFEIGAVKVSEALLIAWRDAGGCDRQVMEVLLRWDRKGVLEALGIDGELEGVELKRKVEMLDYLEVVEVLLDLLGLRITKYNPVFKYGINVHDGEARILSKNLDKPSYLPHMNPVDIAISQADSLLSRRRNPHAAFLNYLYAIRLILDHMISQTTFKANDAESSDAGQQQPPFKNQVVSKPMDSERLFGLAHLCFTEVEDIVNGEMNTDDLDGDDEEDEDEDEDSGDTDDDIRKLVDTMRPLGLEPVPSPPVEKPTIVEPVAPMTVPEPARPELPPRTSSVTSVSTKRDFREQRLTKTRSVKNAVRNSVRMSMLAFGVDSGERKGGEGMASSKRIAYQKAPNLQKRLFALNPLAKNSDASASKKTETIEPDPYDHYLPLIPSSPLLVQHSRLSAEYAKATAELKRLNSRDNIHDPQSTLAMVRRLLETTQLLKNKIEQISKMFTTLSSITILEFTPRAVAIHLTLLDWHLFSRGGVTAEEVVLGFARNPRDKTPAPLRSVLDFSLFVSRIVQVTIVKESLHSQRTRVIATWIDVMEELMGMENYQSLDAILHGLTCPSISRLERSWTGVSRKSRAKLDDVRTLLSPANDYRWYRLAISKVSSPAVPYFRHVLEEIVASKESNLDGICKSLAALRAAGDAGYAKESGEKSDAFLHWLLSQKWMTMMEIENLASSLDEENLGQGMKLLGRLKGLRRKGGEDGVEVEGEVWEESLCLPVGYLEKKVRLGGNVHGPMLLAVVESLPNPLSVNAGDSTTPAPTSDAMQEASDSLRDLDTLQRRLTQQGPPDQIRIMLDRYLFSPEVAVPLDQPLQELPDSVELREIRERLERAKMLVPAEWPMPELVE